MQINLVIIILAVIIRNESIVLQWIALHDTSLHALLNFIVQLFNRANANLFMRILVTPNRQRSTPIAATAEVPVFQILKPFSETSRSC